MLTLALDTTTRAGSAALLKEDEVLRAIEGDPTRTHGERLPGEIARLLDEAGVALAAVDLLAVASGPGALTGLRIGLAAMQGIALATGRPVIGVSALEALAAQAFQNLGVVHARIGSWMDAARGEVFAALYDATGPVGDLPTLTEICEPEVDSPERIWARWRREADVGLVLVGDGAVRYADPGAMGTRVLPHPLLAPAVARLARRVAETGGAHPPHALQPLYVRRPDAERR